MPDIDVKLEPLFKAIDKIVNIYREKIEKAQAVSSSPEAAPTEPPSETVPTETPPEAAPESRPPSKPAPSSGSGDTPESGEGITVPEKPGEKGSLPGSSEAPKGLRSLPWWKTSYSHGGDDKEPPYAPMKHTPRWRDTWKWEGPIGLMKRALLNGIDPYGKAMVHTPRESRLPTLEQYLNMKKTVSEMVDKSFHGQLLLEAEDPTVITLLSDMQKDLKKAIQKFFFKTYEGHAEEIKNHRATHTKDLDSKIEELKSLSAKKDKLELRIKTHIERRNALRLKRRMAKTNKEKNAITAEIEQLEDKTASTKGEIAVANQQKKKVFQDFDDIVKDATPEKLEAFIQKIMQDNGISREEAESVLHDTKRIIGPIKAENDGEIIIKTLKELGLNSYVLPADVSKTEWKKFMDALTKELGLPTVQQAEIRYSNWRWDKETIAAAKTAKATKTSVPATEAVPPIPESGDTSGAGAGKGKKPRKPRTPKPVKEPEEKAPEVKPEVKEPEEKAPPKKRGRPKKAKPTTSEFPSMAELLPSDEKPLDDKKSDEKPSDEKSDDKKSDDKPSDDDDDDITGNPLFQ